MGDIATGLLGKRVIVLGDHQSLCRAIELSFKSLLKMEVVETSPGALVQREGRRGAGDLDLMVMATSSPDSEPIVTLARTSLLENIGRVPLLMISDRPFNSDRDTKIFYLRFPFDSGQLCDKVSEILSEGAWTHRG